MSTPFLSPDSPPSTFILQKGRPVIYQCWKWW